MADLGRALADFVAEVVISDPIADANLAMRAYVLRLIKDCFDAIILAVKHEPIAVHPGTSLRHRACYRAERLLLSPRPACHCVLCLARSQRAAIGLPLSQKRDQNSLARAAREKTRLDVNGLPNPFRP